MDREQQIIDSWKVNAGNWIEIIERNGIASRVLVTNQAIVEAVCSGLPGSILDIGCGEGWLAGVLAGRGMRVSGIDVIPELVEKARQRVRGEFLPASYEDIYENRISLPGPFDAIVINFALIGKESTEKLLVSLPALLAENGRLIIQTLHPHSRKESGDYVSGWKTGSWDGLGDHFTQPYEWYFRTLEDWLLLLENAGFSQVQVKDIVHPQTAQPLSVIFECSLAAGTRK